MPPMTRKAQFTVRHVAWAASRDDLHAIRRKVFIEEQQVPEELEWDDDDALSCHVLAVAEDGTPIGTGRLLRDGHIGRMAVLKEWRRKGVGGALMSHLLRLARASRHEIVQAACPDPRRGLLREARVRCGRRGVHGGGYPACRDVANADRSAVLTRCPLIIW